MLNTKQTDSGLGEGARRARSPGPKSGCAGKARWSGFWPDPL